MSEDEQPALPDFYEPEKRDRIWFRRGLDGQLGYLVRRGGKQMIRLDRPGEEIIKPLNGWVEDKEHRPMVRMQAAMIAKSADEQLCKMLGLHDKRRRTWDDLTEEQKFLWANEGPQDPPARAAVWDGIMRALEPYMR